MTPLRALLVCGFALCAGIAARAADDEAYLFAYFTRNGQDGLHLAASDDGYTWEKLAGGASVLRPAIGSKEKLMRDPSIARGPDGTYHLVWTSGWWERSIGYASTKDFIHWTEQKEIPVMAHESTARNAWAPEIVWDADRSEFLIFWATTIPDRFVAGAGSSEDQLNHRIYFTATKNFTNFTRAELLFDPGFSCIDATLFKVDREWHLFLKDETRFPAPAKNFLHARAASARGPFTKFSAPFSPAGVWVEGPSVVRIGDEFLLYFDAYTAKHYGVLRSHDLAQWEDATRQLRLPDEGTPLRPRHGTVIAVPRAIVSGLQALRPAP